MLPKLYWVGEGGTKFRRGLRQLRQMYFLGAQQASLPCRLYRHHHKRYFHNDYVLLFLFLLDSVVVICMKNEIAILLLISMASLRKFTKISWSCFHKNRMKGFLTAGTYQKVCPFAWHGAHKHKAIKKYWNQVILIFKSDKKITERTGRDY